VPPFGFAGNWGYQEDADSGLKLLGHRYYDSSTGRFLTRDPINDGRNWYANCDNNPLKAVDPTGLLLSIDLAMRKPVYTGPFEPIRPVDSPIPHETVQFIVSMIAEHGLPVSPTDPITAGYTEPYRALDARSKIVDELSNFDTDDSNSGNSLTWYQDKQYHIVPYEESWKK
jgi:RHS repeat-associated protein